MVPDFTGMFVFLIVGSAVAGWIIIESLIWFFSHLSWSL